MEPKVSIIVLNYDGRSKLGSLLDECINSTINQTYKNIEVLFVDNGSVDDSHEYVKAKYGDRARVIRFDHNYGFSLGNNLAARFASRDSEYLLFLNSDAILDPDYVEVIVDFMEKNGGLARLRAYRRSWTGLSLVSEATWTPTAGGSSSSLRASCQDIR